MSTPCLFFKVLTPYSNELFAWLQKRKIIGLLQLDFSERVFAA